jgi:hypothetical protein
MIRRGFLVGSLLRLIVSINVVKLILGISVVY